MGRVINVIRKKVADVDQHLSKRLKKLVKLWQQLLQNRNGLLVPPAAGPGGQASASASVVSTSVSSSSSSPYPPGSGVSQERQNMTSSLSVRTTTPSPVEPPIIFNSVESSSHSPSHHASSYSSSNSLLAPPNTGTTTHLETSRGSPLSHTSTPPPPPPPPHHVHPPLSSRPAQPDSVATNPARNRMKMLQKLSSVKRGSSPSSKLFLSQEESRSSSVMQHQQQSESQPNHNTAKTETQQAVTIQVQPSQSSNNYTASVLTDKIPSSSPKHMWTNSFTEMPALEGSPPVGSDYKTDHSSSTIASLSSLSSSSSACNGATGSSNGATGSNSLSSLNSYNRKRPRSPTDEGGFQREKGSSRRDHQLQASQHSATHFPLHKRQKVATRTADHDDSVTENHYLECIVQIPREKISLRNLSSFLQKQNSFSSGNREAGGLTSREEEIELVVRIQRSRLTGVKAATREDKVVQDTIVHLPHQIKDVSTTHDHGDLSQAIPLKAEHRTYQNHGPSEQQLTGEKKVEDSSSSSSSSSSKDQVVIIPHYRPPPPGVQPGVDGCVGLDGYWYDWTEHINSSGNGEVVVMPYVYYEDDIDTG